MKFKLPGGEVGGNYRNGEVWHLKANERGIVDVPGTEPEILETLTALAEDPSHPIEFVKKET